LLSILKCIVFCIIVDFKNFWDERVNKYFKLFYLMKKYFSFYQSNRRFHSFEAATYRRVQALIEIPAWYRHFHKWNVAKIVCYGGHCDESCNEWQLQKYAHFKYILWQLNTCHNHKNKSLPLIEFFVWIIIFNQVRSKITQSKQKFYNPLIGL
jgi:hypothetical protein